MFAHSTPTPSRSDWEPLDVHLAQVGRLAAVFGERIGWAALAEAAGRLHDIGKASAEFQHYLSAPREEGRKGPDHSTAGAREALEAYGPRAGRWLAYAIAGHHAGLADPDELRRRLHEKELADYAGWRDHTGELPARAALRPSRQPRPSPYNGFSEAFLIRMLFSCLVDADVLSTRAFEEGREPEPAIPLMELKPALTAYMAGKAGDGELNRLRREVLGHALGRAALDPGLFTLTVPTGGGKTLTSLAFALEHARLHKLERVIFVVPYTSIIEQTARQYREALGRDGAVLEHHASFDWTSAKGRDGADSEGRDTSSPLRLASENWDAPVVVTTAVQFFESLYARRTTSCRKLHNIANAVVVLDEAQTLPLRLLLPCMAALDELQRNYGASVVLCTATQPALRRCDGFHDQNPSPTKPYKVGFDIDGSRELAPDPEALFAHPAVQRVGVERRAGKTADAEISARFAEAPRMLCIVNNRRHARDLFDRLKADGATAAGARHLTTLMCPAHRRAVLEDVRARLRAGLPVRLVSTSLIEAGVDVDFPEVWRAVAGLDQIAQAAGRCNREGRLGRLGRTVVFEPEDGKPPRDLRPLIDCAEGVFRAGLDPLSLEGVRSYFREVYWRRGAETLDAAKLDGETWPILPHIAERADRSEVPFETISKVFRLIDDAQASVVVPYDDEAETLLNRIAAMDRPARDDLRRLQQYTVSIPRSDRDAWLADGDLTPVHRRLGDDMLRFRNKAHYRDETGVDLKHAEWRDAAANVI